MANKLAEPKMSISLFVRPMDAIRLVEWAKDMGMIDEAMFVRKKEKAVAKMELIKKLKK